MSGRMNPNASQFSPSAFAMVKRDGAVKASNLEDRPRDLIVHESLKHLIQEMQDLKLRTTYLEEENGRLSHKNEKPEIELSSLRKTFANGSAAPAGSTNLAGYATSDTSSTDPTGNVVSHPNVTGSASDTAALKKCVDEHQQTVNAILEKFNEYLISEVSKREELEKRVNQFQFVLREVKGRVGVLEPKFKAMLSDMDELEVAVNGVRDDNSLMSATTKNDNGPFRFFQDQIEKLGGSVKAAMKKIKELEGDVDTHRMIINELNHNAKSDGSKFEEGWVVTQSAGNNAWTTSRANDGLTVGRSENSGTVELRLKMSQLGKEVQHLQQTLDKGLYEKRAIDNCPTREALYEYYQNYSKEIERTASSTYQDYQDNLWALRDRVIVRLVLFDGYSKAVQEAKTADIGL